MLIKLDTILLKYKIAEINPLFRKWVRLKLKITDLSPIIFNIKDDKKINSQSNTGLSSKKWIVIHSSITDFCMKLGDYKGRKVRELDFWKIFLIWRYSRKLLQISPKSDVYLFSYNSLAQSMCSCSPFKNHEKCFYSI